MPLSREENSSRNQPSGDAQERAATSAETSAAWTPGPWRSVQAKTLTDGARDFAIVAGDKRIVAEVFGRCAEADYPPAAANARLISAAPTMYEALEATTGICAFILTQGICDDDASQLIVAAVEAAEAALAKADGQS